MDDPETSNNWGKRLFWFAGLWLAGVAVVTTVGYAIRAMIL